MIAASPRLVRGIPVAAVFECAVAAATTRSLGTQAEIKKSDHLHWSHVTYEFFRAFFKGNMPGGNQPRCAFKTHFPVKRVCS